MSGSSSLRSHFMRSFSAAMTAFFRRRPRGTGLQLGMLAFQMLAVRPLGGEGDALRLKHRPNLERQTV